MVGKWWENGGKMAGNGGEMAGKYVVLLFSVTSERPFFTRYNNFSR